MGSGSDAGVGFVDVVVDVVIDVGVDPGGQDETAAPGCEVFSQHGAPGIQGGTQGRAALRPCGAAQGSNRFRRSP